MVIPLACSSDSKKGPDVKPIPERPSSGLGIEVGKVIPAWKEGEMDIHFINTTTGESAFVIMPDGTQLLIDAASSLLKTNSDDNTTNTGFRSRWDPIAAGMRGSQIIGDYLKKCMVWTGNNTLDYVVMSHLHNDHMGDCNSSMPKSSKGGPYRINGLTEILDDFPVTCIIDRGWPNYDYPFDMQNLASNKTTINNYIQAVKWHISNTGLRAEIFKAGAADQITPKTSKYDVKVQNIAVNGEIWTGSGSNVKMTFPEKKDIIVANPAKVVGTDKCPPENICSAVMRISYGKFDYFAGADIQYNNKSNFAWKDAELPCAKVAGVVEVMKADHHGSSATNSPDALRALNPQIVVVNSWVDSHPRTAVLAHAEKVLPAADFFVTNLWLGDRPAGVDDKITEAELSRVKGYDGNVVIRVVDNGAKYYVMTTSDSDGKMTVKKISGPYTCR